jgi:hypothetical protein
MNRADLKILKDKYSLELEAIHVRERELHRMEIELDSERVKLRVARNDLYGRIKDMRIIERCMEVGAGDND